MNEFFYEPDVKVLMLKGEKGDKGDQGVSVPAGGTAGQYLKKKTATDYDFEWSDIEDGTVNLLASLTSIPTSSTAVSGTENWKSYDAIYFVVKMHYNEADNISSFTNLILTKTVVIGDEYTVSRQSTSSGQSLEANLNCWFYNDQIKISKQVNKYDIISVYIYGVDF